MKLRSGLLVAALAVPLSFASQSQNSATQTEQRGTRNQQSSTTDQDRSTTQTDRNTATQGTPRENTGTTTDQHGTSTTSRTDRQTDQTTGTRSRVGETAESMVSPADRKFMSEAAAGGVAEVQLAQLAQQKASSDEVKELAKMIEQDHQQANEQLKEIAANRQIDLPAEPGPKHQQLMSKLESMEGAAFDKAYTDAMVKEHKAEIKKFQKQAKNGLDTDVREFAEKTVPSLQKHLQQAEQAKNSTRSRTR